MELLVQKTNSLAFGDLVGWRQTFAQTVYKLQSSCLSNAHGVGNWCI